MKGVREGGKRKEKMRVKHTEVEINMDVDSSSGTVIQQLSERLEQSSWWGCSPVKEDLCCCIRKYTLSCWYFFTILFA